MGGADLYWLSPDCEVALDAIPEATLALINAVAFAFLDRGYPPTRERAGRALGHLSRDQIDPDRLETALVLAWRRTLDEVVCSGDPTVLQVHLDLAPVPEHPLCYYIVGLLAGVRMQVDAQPGERRWTPLQTAM